MFDGGGGGGGVGGGGCSGGDDGGSGGDDGGVGVGGGGDGDGGGCGGGGDDFEDRVNDDGVECAVTQLSSPEIALSLLLFKEDFFHLALLGKRKSKAWSKPHQIYGPRH